MSSGLEIYLNFPVLSPTNVKKKKVQFYGGENPTPGPFLLSKTST